LRRVFQTRYWTSQCPGIFYIKKKRFNIAGVLAVLLVFGLLYTACPTGSDDDGTPGNGSDKAAGITGTLEASGGGVVVFTGNTINYTVTGTTQYSGTFSTAASTITFHESRLGTASGNFELSAGKLVLFNHTWDSVSLTPGLV
jgi:hypothetical protein